ncbi:proton-conducting transporter transmembrane domain-containing protein [Amycolatopsis aidingensis]|uniref:proton-conducting transporter transmembrane domain-containing protein n=1 Tax=Amycolatopsis aidingensis TaxID=2842453 RepID=UPI001C0C8681|nr:proton-conducting transporter membrane subunit [Amycolatopsis aidingensis]
MSALLTLPGLPLAAGAALLCAGRRADRWAPAGALAVAAGVLALAVAVALTRPGLRLPLLAGLPAGLAVDGLSALLVVTVAVVTLAVVVYSAAEFGPGEARGRFFGFLLLFAGAMLVTVTATTLAPLLMAWEVMGGTSYALIGFWWRDRWRVRAGTVAFLTTRAGDLGLYLAAGAAFAAAGSLELDRLATLPAPWLHVAAAGVLLAAAGKSAQLPFSFWLSGAMAGPSPVSALLHSATMVAAGGYLLLRLAPLLHASGWAAATAAWLGALTALLLGALACVQRELKQVLAASTCAQIGFVVLAAGAGSASGGAAHVAGHAVVKCLLFLVAGAFLAGLGSTELAGLRGAGRRYPLAGVSGTVGALTLAGVPPLTLWVTEDLVLAGVSTWLHGVALAATALSGVYAGRVLHTVLARPARADRHRAPLGVTVALCGLALPSAALGLAMVAGTGPGSLRPGPATLSAVVSVAGLGLAVLRARRGAWLPARAVRAGQQWLGLEGFARRAVARPVRRLARLLAAVDDRLLAVVRGAGRSGQAVARAVDRGPEQLLRGTVGGVARAGGRLGALARRPQTGLLHQYYAQVVVVLAVVVAAVGAAALVLAG